MTIVKQMSLFDIQQLLDMQSSRRFDTIFATIDVQPIFQLFSKKTMRGAPRELNYGAMFQSLLIRIVERIPTIKDLVKRLTNDPLFSFDCGFLVSDVIPSEASYSRMIDVISQSNVMDQMHDKLIQIASQKAFFVRNISLSMPHISNRVTHQNLLRKRKLYLQRNVDVKPKKNKLLGSLNKQKWKPS